MSKFRVNLYSAALLPPKQRLTFSALLRYASLGVLLLSLTAFYAYWQLHLSEQALAQALQQKQLVDQQKAELEAKLLAHKPDAALVTEVALASDQLALKQLLIDELAQRASFTRRGFAAVLQDLAAISDTKVWLSRIRIDEQQYTFEGYAEHPQSIPQWVGKLKDSHSLKGQAFSAMSMDRGEGKPLAFTLVSESPKEPVQ
ncbi:MAG: PilN domain-containing protein [Shewanella sp.]|uniref:PilN domain-containing protein n=1 Tax=Shewanella sp. TaxID=50422 RepID=UPI003F367370